MKYELRGKKTKRIHHNSLFLILDSHHGFTLVELLLVTAIITIIGIMSVSFFSRFYTQNSVATTTDYLVGALRKAQMYSIMSKQSAGTWGVKYTTSPSKQITLFLNGDSALDENFSVNNSVTISNLTQVTFAHFTGLPTPFGPTTITISGSNNITKSIIINSQGVVSKQ